MRDCQRLWSHGLEFGVGGVQTRTRGGEPMAEIEDRMDAMEPS